MNEEYISRKDIYNALLDEMAGTGYQNLALDAIRFCENQDVEPVKHGNWIVKREGTYKQLRTYCSFCGKRSGIGGILENQIKPFCPNCGAKMSEEIKYEIN